MLFENFCCFVILCSIFAFASSRPQVSDFQFFYDTNVKYEGSECKTTSGLNGICQSVQNCEKTNIKVSKNDFCSFSNVGPLYCCTTATSGATEPTNLVENKQSDKLLSLRPIEQICEHYYPRDKPPRLVFTGGEKSKADDHPHMAALGWINFDGGIDWRCGGAVVTSNFILTAAHCTSFRGNPPVIARTGDLNLLITENNTFPEDFQITNIYVHPEYKSHEMYHDIALLKISPDFSKRKFLPACIWSQYQIPQQEVLGMGYGTLAFSGPQSNELYEGTLKLQSHEECVQKVPTSPDIPRGIIRGQLCAQDPQNIKDTCQGDSGGPLQFDNSVGYSWRPTIVGITSFGQNCAGSVPGVYTRVSEYLEWLENILLSDFHNNTETTTK